MKRLIFGFGFLGKPVGKAWSAAGDKVFAITRKRQRFAELEAVGIRPILGDVTDPTTLEGLPAVETVLIAVGMDRSVYSDIRAIYVDGLRNILKALPVDTGHLIYVSSTGVYGSSAGDWVDESTEPNPSRDGGRACLEAEQLIKESQFSDRFTILRFAGLYGGSRIPMRDAIAERQWNDLSAHGFLNLIHVEDGVRIIEAIADNGTTRDVFNVSDGNPAPRKEYYEAVAELLCTGPIEWCSANSDDNEAQPSARGKVRSDKRICNHKLCQKIEFDFRYPDFHAGLRKELELPH